jgi:hypothetical protein
MKKIYNYYGLKAGEKLGYDLGRREMYFFSIFGDGSDAVMIKTKDGQEYIFGDLEYCRRMYRAGYSFQERRNGKKQQILLKGFKKALTA